MNYKEQAVEALAHLSTTEIEEVFAEFDKHKDEKRQIACRGFQAHVTYIMKVLDFYKEEQNTFLGLRQEITDNPTVDSVKALQSYVDGFYDREHQYIQDLYTELEEEMEIIDDY